MASSTEERAPREQLKTALRRLYDGSDAIAIGFRWVLLAVDVITVTLFLQLTFADEVPWMIVAEIALGVLLLLDLLARLFISPRPLALLLRPVTLADAIVVISLLAASVADNLGFFRVLRALRLFRSYHILGVLRREWPWVRRNEETLLALINLWVFVFVTTAIVFVSQHHLNPQIENYLDALYFTVTTLTTTGFGDITLAGEWGRLLAVLIMILGISLFLRLLQTLFRPAKVVAACEECGLARHDPDAIHCKHCGTVINIPTSGAE